MHPKWNFSYNYSINLFVDTVTLSLFFLNSAGVLLSIYLQLSHQILICLFIVSISEQRKRSTNLCSECSMLKNRFVRNAMDRTAVSMPENNVKTFAHHKPSERNEIKCKASVQFAAGRSKNEIERLHGQ